jgi:hypothetical protein
MLAPLKDRSILQLDSSGGELGETELLAEIAALRKSLRQSRQMQKRTATISTCQIVELTNKNHRLTELNRHLQARIIELESGQAIVALGQQLMALRQENDELADAAQCVWFLDRTLCAAHHECERLARERDSALNCLQRRADRLID